MFKTFSPVTIHHANLLYIKLHKLILLLLFFVFYVSVPIRLFAQLSCSNMVFAAEKNASLPGCATLGCNKISYDMYLHSNNIATPIHGSQFDLSFVTISLWVGFVTNPVNSHFNIHETTSCASGWHSEAVITPEAHSISVFVGDGMETNTIRFTWNSQKLFYETDHFQVIVDGFTGEAVELDLDGDILFSAAGTPCQMFGSSPLSYTFPSATSSSDITLDFDQFDPQTNVLPIIIKNQSTQTYTFSQINFTLTLEPDGLMIIPSVNCGGTIIFPTQVGNLYNFIVSIENITVNPGQNDLCEINIEEPIPSNKHLSVEACFSTATFNSGTTSLNCITPTIGDCVIVSRGTDSYCDPNIFYLNVHPYVDQVGNCQLAEDCGELRIVAEITWDYVLNGQVTPEQIQIDKLKFTFNLEQGNGLSITGIDCMDLPCENPNSSIDCPGVTACYDFNASSFTYCYSGIGTVPLTRGSRVVLLVTGNIDCVNNAFVEELYIDPEDNFCNVDYFERCIPNFNATDFPMCHPEISGEIRTPDGDFVDQGEIEIKKTIGGCVETIILERLPYSRCVCLPAPVTYDIEPLPDNDDYAWGLTTNDLLRISRHILGVIPFTSPYQIIAADANGSNSVTTNDIVKIRAVLLGVNSDFGNGIISGIQVPSWRYIPEAFSFPVPSNPWNSAFPEQITNVVPPISQQDFVAVKIGDVNYSYYQKPSKIQNATIIAQPKAHKEFIDIPILYNGKENLSAFQIAIKFDIAIYEYIGISAGDVHSVSSACFAENKVSEGKLRFAWFDAMPQPTPSQTGQIFFYLHLRKKAGVSVSPKASLIVLDDNGFNNIAFTEDGNVLSLNIGDGSVSPRQLFTDELSTGKLNVSISPNPFSDAITIQVDTDHESSGSLWLFDSYGVRVRYTEINLANGNNTYKIDHLKKLPTGVYTLKVRNDKEKAVFKVIKH